MFTVYSLTRALPKKEGCIIVREGNLVEAIYTPVFGPSAIEECEKWVSDNCDPSMALSVGGDTAVVYSDEDLYLRPTEEMFVNSSVQINDQTAIVPRNERFGFSGLLEAASTITIYANGPQGSLVNNFLYFLEEGGHKHGSGTRDPRAVGRIDPDVFVLDAPYPQNFPQVYTPGDVSSEVLLRSVAQFPNGQVQVFDGIFTIVHTEGLRKMPSSTGISQVGQTGPHPDNHWGTPALCNALAQLGAAFYGKFNKPIYLNDMSLKWGGLFDINANFQTPHATHRDGRNADLNYSSMNEEEAEFFRTKAQEIGFSVDLHGTPLHWHLRL